MNALLATSSSIHASCVVIGEHGVLIRGESGSGKSTLARHLVGLATQSGVFARLVGDDRVVLTESNGRLVASGHPAIAGMIEVRGVGIIEMPYESACIVRLVVDCLKRVRLRSPDEADRMVNIQGVRLPRLETLAADGLLIMSILGLAGREITIRAVEQPGSI